jgi:hypothetical protein
MNLSHSDFRTKLANGSFKFPSALLPYSEIDPIKYQELEAAHAKSGKSFAHTLGKIRSRVDRDQFGKIYALQTRTLSHASRAFPSYRFIVSEVIANDWLASVDWRKFHRDHVVHQPQVAYVLLSLLDELIIDGRPFIEHCLDNVLRLVRAGYLGSTLRSMGVANNDLYITDNSLSRTLWRRVFRETAFLAALFHDIGYPWQYVNRMEAKLPSAHDGRHPVTPHCTAILNEFENRLVLLPFEGYNDHLAGRPANWTQEKLSLIQKCLCESHGLPGALFFLYLNDRVRPYPSERKHPIRRLCVEWAAMAILMHDLQPVYWKNSSERVLNPHLRLKLDVDPLSCVLTLADTVQDFERHLAKFSRGSGETLRVEYPIACGATDVNFDDLKKELKITYVMNSTADTVLKRSYMPEDERLLFDPIRGFVDLSACGVKRVLMAARTVP